MDIAEHDHLANRKDVPYAVADGYRSAIREIERLRKALEFYADAKNWWCQNVDDPLNYHNSNLDGSIERMNAKVGILQPAGANGMVHAHFFNDGGDRARRALGR